MVKSTFHMVNFVLFIWSTFYFLYVQVDFLYGQVDFLYGQVDFSHRQLFTFYIGQCKMQTADFRLQTGGKVQTEDCRSG